MNHYEVTFLVNEAADAKEIRTALESLGGKLLEEKAWGSRALAYQINKIDAAEYFTYQIQLDSKNLAEFKQKMNFNDKIVRYLLLKKED